MVCLPSLLAQTTIVVPRSISSPALLPPNRGDVHVRVTGFPLKVEKRMERVRVMVLVYGGVLLGLVRRFSVISLAEAAATCRPWMVPFAFGMSLLACLINPLGANATVPVASLDTGFPRVALQWPDPAVQSLTDIARHDYVLLQPRQKGYVGALKAINPRIIVMTSTNPCEVGLDSSPNPPSWANAEISKLPNEWMQTQLGSNLTRAVGADDPVFELTDASRFRVGDAVVIDKELAKVVAVGATSISVSRGILPSRSPAAAHSAGTRVAPIVVFWPGSVVMDLSEFCPRVTVDPAYPLETWAEYNARRGAGLLEDAGWDGIFVDRADATPSMVVGGPWARSIDPRRNNIPVTDNYAELNASWGRSLRNYEAHIRAVAGTRLILTNNAFPNFDLLNGMIFESTPRLTWSAAFWSDRILGTSTGPNAGRSYADWALSAMAPNLTTIQTYESDLTPAKGGTRFENPFGTPGWQPNYRKMRFGLCTALLEDGFFNYSMNTAGHGSLGIMWFDEYDNAGAKRGYLGKPTGSASLAPPLKTPDSLGGRGLFSDTYSFAGWAIYAPSGYSVNGVVDGGPARLTVTTSKGVTDAASFYYGGIPIEAGKAYTLTFRARASREVRITERLAARAGVSPTLSNLPATNLGTTWQQYELSFIANASNSAAVLAFGIGERPASIWIDNVRLQKGTRQNVYLRPFDGGMAIVNLNTVPVTVALGSTYRRIKGTQVPSVNSGVYASAVTVPAQDGLVLLRTPTLTVSRERLSVTFGGAARIAGSLRAVSGGVLPRRSVVLLSSIDGARWRKVARTSTSDLGTYSFSVVPTRFTRYSVRFYGDENNLQGFSRPVAVRVNRSRLPR